MLISLIFFFYHYQLIIALPHSNLHLRRASCQSSFGLLVPRKAPNPAPPSPSSPASPSSQIKGKRRAEPYNCFYTRTEERVMEWELWLTFFVLWASQGFSTVLYTKTERVTEKHFVECQCGMNSIRKQEHICKFKLFCGNLASGPHLGGEESFSAWAISHDLS